jgi:predicted nucleic acid-binding Zn ribbon protein
MSKYLRPEQQKATVPKHKHCIVCATPIAFEREFCGPNCEDQFRRSEKKRKYTQLIMMLMIPLMVVILLLFRPR